MTDFIKAVDDEIARIKAELEADLRYQRLRELRKVRALYSPQRDHVTDSASNRTWTVETFRPDVFRKRTRSPERQRVIDAAKMYLSNRRGPVATREIFEHVRGLGIAIPGKDPLNNLSAMLSNSPEFVSQGREGWLLAGPARSAVLAIDPLDLGFIGTSQESPGSDGDVDGEAG